MRIAITVSGHAERLLKAMCELDGNTPEDLAREGLANAINAFNHRRVDSRGLMSRAPRAPGDPVGPDLLPGEAERARRIARLSVASATPGQDIEHIRRELRKLWPEGIHADQAD